MSYMPAADPKCEDHEPMPITRVLEARARDLGGFSVRRVLPASHQGPIGPFVFFDHSGPARFAPGRGLDVRPHPHIGLATITYLLEGELIHRDSLGNEQRIIPGDVNWLTAGSGIVHSERSALDLRASGAPLHAIQAWVALPKAAEETAPSFEHYRAERLPALDRDGAKIRLIAGAAYGARAPVRTLSPLFYADIVLSAGAQIDLPPEYEHRAAYIVDGTAVCGRADAASASGEFERFGAGRMVVFEPRQQISLWSNATARILLIGGAPLDGERYLYWNFVSSSKERIEEAKRDWVQGRFRTVPGDEAELIPLQEM